MKFKKFLCLTLATTIAFTATLSSSVSIFADDVDIQETEESQSFASSIFEEMLSKSKESNIENPNDYGISLMWLKDGHDKIADYNLGDLPEYHIRILKATSYWADRWFSSRNDAVVKIPALHGTGNYVINLEFLWYFSVFLGRQSDPENVTDMDKKISAAKNSAIEKIKGTTAYENRGTNDNQLETLISNCKKLVKYDGWNGVNSTKLTATEMKMRILGYAAHLLGDVYSHRTILHNTNRLTMSYFTSNLATDVAKEIVEYRFLAKLPKDGGYLLNENDKTIVNRTCVDSPNYCPNRYDDAKFNVSLLVTEKSSEYDYYWFLCPCSDDVKLSNFKKYVKNSGLDTSELTASQWAKYST